MKKERVNINYFRLRTKNKGFAVAGSTMVVKNEVELDLCQLIAL